MNAWERAMSLHVVMPRFVAPLFREIILFVFPALKEMQISAAGFRALMWWKLLRITTTTASPVYTIPSEEDWRAWSRWTKNNFQHGALEHLTWRRSTLFLSGKCYENSPYLLSSFAWNLHQFPGFFAEPDTLSDALSTFFSCSSFDCQCPILVPDNV